MSESLYALNDQLMLIDRILEENTNEDSGEILEQTRDVLLQQIDGKIENILDFIGQCKSHIEYLKSEEKRLATRRKTFENKIEWLKNTIIFSMKLRGISKGDFGTYKVSLAKSPDKIVVNDEALQFLPEDCLKVEKTPLKTVIKEKMGDLMSWDIEVEGQKINLARVESGGESLRYK